MQPTSHPEPRRSIRQNTTGERPPTSTLSPRAGLDPTVNIPSTADFRSAANLPFTGNSNLDQTLAMSPYALQGSNPAAHSDYMSNRYMNTDLMVNDFSSFFSSADALGSLSLGQTAVCDQSSDMPHDAAYVYPPQRLSTDRDIQNIWSRRRHLRTARGHPRGRFPESTDGHSSFRSVVVSRVSGAWRAAAWRVVRVID